MDIFEQIRKEHQEVEGMLQELSKGYDRQLIKSLRIYYGTHMSTEEATLYPAMGEQESDVLLLVKEEHNRIRGLLVNLGTGEAEFPSKLAVLAEVMREHLEREEQALLPKAQQILDQGTVESLSYQFSEINRRKRESVL